jgi:hypothetical protein
MSKQKKSRDTTPSDKMAGGKKRNAHGKKEAKETIAAEAIVTAKKAEPAPAASPAPAAKKAGPVPNGALLSERPAASPPAAKKAEPAPRPAAKAPAKPAAKSAPKPAAPPAPKSAVSASPQRPTDGLAGAAETFERSFKEARQGTLAVNRKLIDFARTNINSSLDHVRDLAAARSPVRIMRLQMEYWHECLETFASQAQELRALSAECVARASEPVREHMRTRPGRTAA